MTKKLCIFFCIIISCSGVVFGEAITITEIMYNPEGKDNNKEYVEVLTEGEKLKNYTIEEFANTADNDMLLWFAECLESRLKAAQREARVETPPAGATTAEQIHKRVAQIREDFMSRL